MENSPLVWWSSVFWFLCRSTSYHWLVRVLRCSMFSIQLLYLHTVKEVRRRRQWHPTPVLLPGESYGRRSLEGCSPWGCWESDTTERLHFHFSLSCIGRGNDNPLQCSCLENPKDGGAWWAAVCGVVQSRTRLKRLSSSSSSSSIESEGLLYVLCQCTPILL